MCCLKSQTQSVWGHFNASSICSGLQLLSALLVLCLLFFEKPVFPVVNLIVLQGIVLSEFITLCFQKVEDVQQNRKVHRTLPKDQTQLLSLQHDHKQKKEPSKSSNSAVHPSSSSTGKEVPFWPM